LQITYWEFIEEELHKRRQQGMSPQAAASPAFQSSPFAKWDSPERPLRNAQALYEEWGHRPVPLPEKLARLNTLRQQGILALMQPEATRPLHAPPLGNWKA